MNAPLSFPNLGDTLARGLSHPDGLPRPTIGPTLSYGRHRGPATRTSRLAAVVVAIYRNADGRPTIPLTLRPTTLLHHGGQVCLPGGRIEPGEDIDAAAMREFEEELGVTPRVQRRLGELSTQYVYASDNLVYPVVMWIDPPTHDWRPDPVEVAEVIELPLDTLADPANRIELEKRRIVRGRTGEVGQMAFRATAIRCGKHDIWGATGMILDQLAQLLQTNEP